MMRATQMKPGMIVHEPAICSVRSALRTCPGLCRLCGFQVYYPDRRRVTLPQTQAQGHSARRRWRTLITFSSSGIFRVSGSHEAGEKF
jgi:hypothetical protein